MCMFFTSMQEEKEWLRNGQKNLGREGEMSEKTKEMRYLTVRSCPLLKYNLNVRSIRLSILNSQSENCVDRRLFTAHGINYKTGKTLHIHNTLYA